MRKVIVNTTPLIALCHVSKLGLLKPIIQEMIDKNIYISEKLMKLCLEQVNEEM